MDISQEDRLSEINRLMAIYYEKTSIIEIGNQIITKALNHKDHPVLQLCQVYALNKENKRHNFMKRSLQPLTVSLIRSKTESDDDFSERIADSLANAWENTLILDILSQESIIGHKSTLSDVGGYIQSSDIITMDAAQEAVHTLPRQFTSNATWIMSPYIQTDITPFDQILMNETTTLLKELLGKPVVYSKSMPTGSYPAILCDLAQGYSIFYMASSTYDNSYKETISITFYIGVGMTAPAAFKVIRLGLDTEEKTS